MADFKLLLALCALFVGQVFSVEITSPAEDTVALTTGEMLHLECEDAEEAVTWKHNGMALTDGEHHKITTSEGGKHSILHVESVATSDQGRYVCEVDPFSNDEVTVTVTEGDGPEVTIVEPDTDSTTLAAGDDLTLKCKGGPVQLYWSFKGAELMESSRVVITDLEDVNTRMATSMLSVRAVTADDAGNYECKDRDDPLFSVDSIEVVVGAEGEAANVEIVSPSDSSVDVKPDHIIELKCSASETTELAWYKDDVELSETEAVITMATEGGKMISLLTVEDAQEDNSGVYSCRNKADDTDKDDINVKVTDDCLLGLFCTGARVSPGSFLLLCACAMLGLVFTKRE